ncbi:MAG: AraC family transcriptional regulator [Opitutaceae bacterium]|nr:AraC family transcriptional regulator [Opitutaceae bacterium]
MPVHKQRFRRSRQVEALVRVRPVFDDFHLLRMEGDYEYPRHQHANYEAILVERGPYRCELNGGNVTLVAGQMLVIKPGDWHSDQLRDGQLHYVLHFRLVAAPGEPPPPPLFRDDTSPAEQVCRGDYLREAWFLRELRAEAENDQAYGAAVQDGLLGALFWRLVRGLDPTALSAGFRRIPADEARREEIAQVFSRYVGENPNVSEMARALGVSSRHLANECQRFFGLSPARLLLRMKVERAEELLRYRSLRVKEISERLGFSNPYHFSTAFRRLRGQAPTESRGSLRGAKG